MVELTCETHSSDEEPPSFLLGQDREGHWVVEDVHGLCGGLFTSELAATRYARFEGAPRGAIIQMARTPMEFPCSSRAAPTSGTPVAGPEGDAHRTDMPQYKSVRRF